MALLVTVQAVCLRTIRVSAVALSLLVFSGAASAQTPQLHLGSTPWSPFTNEPGNTRFANDLVDEALKRIGITADTTIVEDGTLTAALTSGRFNGSAALWHDAARERFLIYSEPYLENRLVLVGRHGGDVSAANFAALSGKRIALIDGYSYGEGIKASPGPTFVAVRTIEESVERLLAGEVDYTLIDELVVEYLVENYPREVSARLAIGTAPMLVRPLHFAVRRDLPGAASIIERFNNVLRGMVADRSYHRLLHIPWISADIDGDGRAELVPDQDEVSATAPNRGYELFTGKPAEPGAPEVPVTPRRFYVGGSIYEEWTMVPDAYKVRPAGAPAPLGGNTASLFTFRW